MDLPILDILCKYSHTVSFSLHNVFRVRTFYSMSQYFIPFYDYNIYMDIYHSLFIHLLLNIWPVSTFWLLWKILPERGCASFCVNVCSSCLRYIPRREIIESRDNSVPNCFPKQLYHFTFIPTMCEDSNFSTSWPQTIFVCLFDSCHQVDVKWYLIVVLICVSIVINEHLFMCLLSLCIYLLWRNIFLILYPV